MSPSIDTTIGTRTDGRTSAAQATGSVDADRYPHEVRAAVLRASGEPMTVETIRLKEVGPGDVRVRIEKAGVCPSDLSLATLG